MQQEASSEKCAKLEEALAIQTQILQGLKNALAGSGCQQPIDTGIKGSERLATEYKLAKSR